LPGAFVQHLALDPGGSFGYSLYRLNGGTSVVVPSHLDVGASALLQNTDTSGQPVSFSIAMDFRSVTADPSGRFVYFIDANGTVWAYLIDSVTGNLTAAASSPKAVSASQPLIFTKQ
jgi:hypothetical protein